MLAHISFSLPLWPRLGSYIMPMDSGAAAGPSDADAGDAARAPDISINV